MGLSCAIIIAMAALVAVLILSVLMPQHPELFADFARTHSCEEVNAYKGKSTMTGDHLCYKYPLLDLPNRTNEDGDAIPHEVTGDVHVVTDIMVSSQDGHETSTKQIKNRLMSTHSKIKSTETAVNEMEAEYDKLLSSIHNVAYARHIQSDSFVWNAP